MKRKFSILLLAVMVVSLLQPLQPVQAQSQTFPTPGGDVSFLPDSADGCGGKSIVHPCDVDNNLAIKTIDVLFGDGWENTFARSSSANLANASVISRMFLIFNTVVLFGTGLIVLGTLSTGLFETEIHGTPMGQRYSTIWTPVRSVLSIGLMIPIPGQVFTVLQALILTFLFYANGAADNIWATAVNHMKNNTMGSVHSIRYGKLSDSTMADVMETWGLVNLAAVRGNTIKKFDLETNYKTLHSTGEALAGANSLDPGNVALEDAVGISSLDLTGELIPEQQQKNDPGFWEISFCLTYSGGQVSCSNRFADLDGAEATRPPDNADFAPDDLGTIRIPCLDRDSPLCLKRRNWTVEAFTTAGEIGARIATYVNQSVEYGAGAVDKPAVLSDPALGIRQMEEAAQTYNGTMRDQLRAAYRGEEILGGFKDRIENFANVSSRLGWASAGFWFWELSKINQRAQRLSNLAPSFEGGSPKKIYASLSADITADASEESFAKQMKASDIGPFWSFVQNAKRKIPESAMRNYRPAQSGSVIVSIWQTTLNLLGFDELNFGSALQRVFRAGSPVMAMQGYGMTLLNTGTLILIAGGVGGSMVASALSMAGMAGLGSLGGPQGTLAGGLVGGGLVAAGQLVSTFSTLFTMIAIALLTIGFALGYVLPAMPFLIWTLSYVGWIILFAEIMIICPVWAAAHAIPEGEGFAGRHGTQGYMLFFNVFFRPSLMVFGFFLAVVLTAEVARYIDIGFTIFTGTMDLGAWGPFDTIALSLIFGGLFFECVRKLFGLISWLPNNALRWIGQNAVGLGEQQSARQVNQMAAVVAGRIGGQMPGALPSGTGKTPGKSKSKSGSGSSGGEPEGGAKASDQDDDAQ